MPFLLHEYIDDKSKKFHSSITWYGHLFDIVKERGENICIH